MSLVYWYHWYYWFYRLRLFRMAKDKGKQAARERRISNRRARFEYHILETLEAGLNLLGTEVKSIRAGNASLDGAFAHLRGGELWLCGCNIAIYPQAVGSLQHEPLRDRKLLARRSQLHKLQTHVAQKGHTLVPLAIYFKRGWAKCEIGAAVGKKAHDKRRAMQDRQQQRDIAREMHRRGRER